MCQGIVKILCTFHVRFVFMQIEYTNVLTKVEIYVSIWPPHQVMLIFPRFIFYFLSLFRLLASETGNPSYFSSAEFTSANIGRHKELLRRMFLAVENVVSFFAREYRNFNIDGVFGLHALDGKL